MTTVKFSKANPKLASIAPHANVKKAHIVSFDISAGHTCPAANECLAKVFGMDDGTRVLVRGDDAKFLCYAAKAENQYKYTYAMRKKNWQAMIGKDSNQVAEILQNNIPKTAKIVRIHSSGDFFSKAYFHGWIKFAQNRPDLTFFGYSKMLDYVRTIKNLDLPNFSMVYSYGGLMDSRVTKDDFVSYVITPDWIINSEQMTATSQDGSTTVPIACTSNKATSHLDYFAIVQKSGSFGLMLH